MTVADIKSNAIEQAVLGMLLFDNNTYDIIADIVIADFFADEFHRDLYKNIVNLIRQGRVANPLTLISVLNIMNEETNPELKYLLQLIENVTSTEYIEQYATILKDMFLKRKILALSQDIQEQVFSLSASELIDKIEGRLLALNTNTNRNQMITLFDAAESVVNKITNLRNSNHHISGTPTGFVLLDKMIGGFSPGELVIIAGRPSMGKTALITNMATNVARDKKYGGAVAFFSLEMPYEQIVLRMLSGEVGICSSDLRTGRIPVETITQLIDCYQSFSDIKLFIDDTPNITINAIRSKARTIKRKHGLSLIAIDYLQLINGRELGKIDTRSHEIDLITQGLKAIAKELSVPVVALSQLSRVVEQQGGDQRPQLSHLRESGSIEQAGDKIMFIVRDEYLLMRKEPKDNDPKWLEWKKALDASRDLAEIFIDKNRNGPIGSVKLGFNSKLTLFYNVDAESL